MAESNKKISKQALKKSFRNWYYGHLTCFSQEHMQTFGYLCSMLPIIEDLYDTKEEQKEALETYTAFFNTEPQLGTVVVGITAGLMGPVAGIGDSLVVGTLIPILLGIALGLSTNGSPLGAIFYIVVWNLVITIGMRFLYYKGYELGGKAVEIIVGEKANAIRESVIMLGTIVIGAVAASWISVTTSFKMFNSEGGIIIDLQNVCDGIFPKLLPLLTVIFCWFLMSKKKMSPTKVMLILVVIAFIGVLVGFFNPGLQY